MRATAEDWIRAHRRALWTGWAAVGAAVVAWLLLWGPEVVWLRGIAPWPRRWILVFFLSLWAWVGLRFIALWIWAWVAMAIAPVSLFVPLRFHLEAWWLLPLLAGVVAASLLTVVVVVVWELRRDACRAPERRSPDVGPRSGSW